MAEAPELKSRYRRPSECAGRNANERRASLEKDNVQADPILDLGKADTTGGIEQMTIRVAAPGYWRQHVHKENARNTGSPMAW